MENWNNLHKQNVCVVVKWDLGWSGSGGASFLAKSEAHGAYSGGAYKKSVYMLTLPGNKRCSDAIWSKHNHFAKYS